MNDEITESDESLERLTDQQQSEWIAKHGVPDDAAELVALRETIGLESTEADADDVSAELPPDKESTDNIVIRRIRRGDTIGDVLRLGTQGFGRVFLAWLKPLFAPMMTTEDDSNGENTHVARDNANYPE